MFFEIEEDYSCNPKHFQVGALYHTVPVSGGLYNAGNSNIHGCSTSMPRDSIELCTSGVYCNSAAARASRCFQTGPHQKDARWKEENASARGGNGCSVRKLRSLSFAQNKMRWRSPVQQLRNQVYENSWSSQVRLLLRTLLGCCL
mgnify:CR=1 FL=1